MIKSFVHFAQLIKILFENFLGLTLYFLLLDIECKQPFEFITAKLIHTHYGTSMHFIKKLL